MTSIDFNSVTIAAAVVAVVFIISATTCTTHHISEKNKVLMEAVKAGAEHSYITCAMEYGVDSTTCTYRTYQKK